MSVVPHFGLEQQPARLKQTGHHAGCEIRNIKFFITAKLKTGAVYYTQVHTISSSLWHVPNCICVLMSQTVLWTLQYCRWLLMPGMLLKQLQSSCCIKPIALTVGTVEHSLLGHRGKTCHHLELPGWTLIVYIYVVSHRVVAVTTSSSGGTIDNGINFSESSKSRIGAYNLCRQSQSVCVLTVIIYRHRLHKISACVYIFKNFTI